MSGGRERSEAPEGAQRSGRTGPEKTAARCVERRPQCRAELRSHSAAQDCETRNGATKRRRKFTFLRWKTVTSCSREEVFGRRRRKYLRWKISDRHWKIFPRRGSPASSVLSSVAASARRPARNSAASSARSSARSSVRAPQGVPQLASARRAVPLLEFRRRVPRKVPHAL